MIRKGFMIDTLKFEYLRDCTYDDTRIEGMFVKVDGKDLIPAAYVYPIENKNKVLFNLEGLKASKKQHEDRIARVFYKELPNLR